MIESEAMDFVSAKLANQSVLDAQSRTRDALHRLDEESLRAREASDKFYGNLGLFSGGTIALSITYLAYLKSVPNKGIIYPSVLIAAWVVLMVCVVASLFSTLFSSYYAHFARLRIYIDTLIEQKETFVQEMDNLYIVNLTGPGERQSEKQRFADEANSRRKDSNWAKKREVFFRTLWAALGWISGLSFPIGLALLIFFAVENM